MQWTNISSRFAKEGDSSYQTTEPMSIGSLYSVGVVACVLPKSRYTLTPLIPQATSSNGDLILAVYCTRAKSQEHMPFPYFPLCLDKCVLHGI